LLEDFFGVIEWVRVTKFLAKNVVLRLGYLRAMV
jgi:hypothetical protein